MANTTMLTAVIDPANRQPKCEDILEECMSYAQQCTTAANLMYKDLTEKIQEQRAAREGSERELDQWYRKPLLPAAIGVIGGIILYSLMPRHP